MGRSSRGVPLCSDFGVIGGLYEGAMVQSKHQFQYFVEVRSSQLWKAKSYESGELVQSSGIAGLLFAGVSLTVMSMRDLLNVSRYSVLGQHLLAFK
jgi:hypothetical protein